MNSLRTVATRECTKFGRVGPVQRAVIDTVLANLWVLFVFGKLVRELYNIVLRWIVSQKGWSQSTRLNVQRGPSGDLALPVQRQLVVLAVRLRLIRGVGLLQLLPGQVLHDGGTVAVAQEVVGRADAITGVENG